MTSISKLIVGGFKSIRDRTEIPIAPLTFLFGPNSAGKSAVLGSVHAFRDRIREVFEFDPKAQSDNRVYGPHVYRSGRIHSKPLRSIDIEDDGDLMPLHLGVGLENFNIEDAHFDEICPDSSKSFFGALDRAAVEVEVIELVGRGSATPLLFRATESYLRIDNEELFHFVPKGFVECWESAPCINERECDRRLTSVGAVLINLAHPLWTMTAIRDSQSHLNQVGLDSALISDIDRSSIVEILNALKSEVLKNEYDFFQQLIEVNDSFLRIRTEVDFLYADKWSPNVFGLDGAYETFWKRDDLSSLEKSKFLTVEKMVNEILMFIAGLGRIVLIEVDQCMRVVSVDGDRQIFRPESLTVNLPLSMSRGVLDDYWKTTWVSMSANNSVRYRIDHTLMYAYWLGLKQVGSRFLSKDDFQKIQCRDDFVNCIFNQGFFGFRQYEVKPEVWSITTEKLASRGRIEEAEGDVFHTVDLKVQLYLEDQNGRRLDFNEVGSGISYVMPILASLNSAKTSWVAQPELHLHPAAQCEMGDVFLRAFNRGHFSVVETHSEHLLLRVLKRIRQTTHRVEIDGDLKCAPEAVSVLYFDPQEDGSTQIKQMRVTRLGDFKDRWPHGFFEERGRELFDE